MFGVGYNHIPSSVRRVCVCRPRYGLSNDMFLEEFRRYFEEMEYIQFSIDGSLDKTVIPDKMKLIPYETQVRPTPSEGQRTG